MSSSSSSWKVPSHGRAKAAEPAAPEAPLEPVGSQEPQEGDSINNRYRVVRKLGHGGMGSVYLVEDNWRGDRRLAMKRVRKDRLDARTITILRNEFLALSALAHPNLARVFDFEVDLATQDFFFTSEYVEGVQLLKAAREFQIARRGDFLRFLSALAQILRALEFIHSRGLVHGDIKPENLLISGSLSDRKGAEEFPPLVKMIDFGLTKREKEFGGKRIVGTTYYIAPETILGSQVDRRTDLYSLGVVLYHITTRKLPFTGDSSMAVLRGHIEKAPNPPNVVEPAVPEPLSEMILRLMEKQPANRYHSALELIEALNAAFGTDFPLETPETRLSYIRSSGFIARESEMAELVALFEDAYHLEAAGESDDDLKLPADITIPAVVAGGLPPPPPGRTVLIRGEAGVGKRRLLKEFRRYVQTHGVHYLEIGCGEPEVGARRSFSELMQAQMSLLSARVQEEGPDPLRLEAFMEKLEKEVTFPLSFRPTVDKLAHKMLKASQATPLVLAFTDLQKADIVLLEFLRSLIGHLAGRTVAGSQLLVVATAEDGDPEEARLRPFLAVNDLRAAIRELPLSRFSVEEVSKLVASMFGGAGDSGKGPLNDRLIDLIYEESDGNPGVVEEILEFLISGDRLVRAAEGWTFQGTVDRQAIPGKVRRELRDRIEGLDVVSRRLATALALLAPGGELDVAARLAAIPPGQIIDAVLALKQARIIREEKGEEAVARYSFIHKSAQDILYAGIAETARAAAHDQAGLLLEAHLEAVGQRDPCRLASHFLRAENAAAALRYGLEAAQEYGARSVPRKAIEVYGEVRRFALASDPALARQIDRAVARLHFHIGQYRAAAEILQGLAGWKPGGIVEEPLGGLAENERAMACVSLGEALCRMGNFQEAAGCFNEAFRRLKGGASTSELAALLLGFAELHHHKGSFAESLRYCERVQVWEKNLPVELETSLYLLLADNHFRLDNKEIAVRHCQRGLELLGSQRNIERMALTLLYLGKFYTYKGRFQKALKNLLQSAMVNQRIGAADRQADCLREVGAIYLSLDNPHEAKRHLSEAIAIYQRTENVAASVEALNLHGECSRILGYYDDAQKDLQKALQLNSSVGNLQNAAESYLATARMAIDHGQLQKAERYLAEAQRCQEEQIDDRVPLKVLVLRGGMEMARGQLREALDLAARGTIAAREIGNRLRTAPLLDQQVRLQLMLGRPVEARRILAALSEIAQRYGLPVLEGRVFLLTGMLLATEGKPEEASQSFERALNAFREERSERDLVDAYLEYGRLQLSVKSLEQAYILFEEGLYLAKKLNLAQAKCHLYHQMGILESMVHEGVFARAVGYFSSAERQAQSVPYPDLLWRIRHDLGKLYHTSSRLVNASRTLSGAVEAQKEQLQKIPESFRQSYLAASGLTGLEQLHLEVKARAEVQVRRERMRYPARNPEQDLYFGLTGRSASMRELFRLLAALPPDPLWVWVWGRPGSGRKQVARAIHSQSVPDREGIWELPASRLDPAALARVLGEVEKAREVGSVLPEKTAAGAAEEMALPGRFTLIVTNAQGLAPEVQKSLWERVITERGRLDGLRVVATLDAPPDRPPASPPGSGGQGPLIAELQKEGFPALRVPSLGERMEDLPLLVTRFLEEGRRATGEPPPRLSEEALEVLEKHPFPEELRDLKDICDKLRRFAGAGSLGAQAIRTILTPTLRIARRK